MYGFIFSTFVNYRTLSTTLLKGISYLGKSFTTVRVIFDRYKTESLKSRTSPKKTSGKAVRYQVIEYGPLWS